MGHDIIVGSSIDYCLHVHVLFSYSSCLAIDCPLFDVIKVRLLLTVTTELVVISLLYLL